MRRCRTPWSWLAVLLLASACTADPPDEPAEVDLSTSVENGDAVDRGATMQVTVELEHPDRIPTGHTVPFAVRVVNPGPGTVDLSLTGDPVAVDVVVRDRAGQVLWRRLHGEMIGLVLQLRSLGPGEALEFHYEWDLRDNEGNLVPPGTYRVQARVPAEEAELVSAEGELTIEG
jgi:hypothetical protein